MKKSHCQNQSKEDTQTVRLDVVRTCENSFNMQSIFC